MADAISNLVTGAGATTQPTVKEKNDQLGKTEFLQLLVTQLKNQDPLDPMKNEDFAVNLAQFSQLEQLIGINEKIGGSSGADGLSSLAAYLGQEVVLNKDSVNVENGDGGSIKFDLPRDASAAAIQFLDENGTVAHEIDVGQLAAGDHTIQLNGLPFNGNFGVKVKAVGSNGGQFEAPVSVAGIVSGFIPGPEPVLIVGGQEVSPADIVSVHMSSQG